MAKLIIAAPGMPVWEVELKPGRNRVGRAADCDVAIDHPSVSGHHCEILDSNGALVVKDLGSTNGTFLDGQPVQEGPWSGGQILRAGEVTLTQEKVGATAIPTPPMLPATPQPIAAVRPLPWVKPKEKPNFFRVLPTALIFPLRGDALYLLAAGTVFFALLRVARSGFVSFAIIGVGLYCSGYLFNFVVATINTSAMGAEDVHDWGDFEDWTDVFTGAVPKFLIFALLVFAPGLIYRLGYHHPKDGVLAVIWLVELFFLPMGLLAVAIYDSVLALNPVLLVLSIIKVPLEYFLVVVGIAVLIVLNMALDWIGISEAHPFFGLLASEFLYLYTLMVLARMLGLLYYTRKERLGWVLTGR